MVHASRRARRSRAVAERNNPSDRAGTRQHLHQSVRAAPFRKILRDHWRVGAVAGMADASQEREGGLGLQSEANIKRLF